MEIFRKLMKKLKIFKITLMFFLAYMKETGVEGVTNYTHMLGSGHVILHGSK
jgi:hypothetical protein